VIGDLGRARAGGFDESGSGVDAGDAGAEGFEAACENALAAAPSSVDLWLGAHTHTTPDDTYGGKSHIERRWGTTFINAAGLTLYHSVPGSAVPRSWLLTFTEGSDEVSAHCYLHGNEYAPQGWYAKVDRVIKLSKPFKMPISK